MSDVNQHEDSTYIYQDGLKVSVQTYEPGKKDACLLVRSTCYSGSEPRHAISAGFDLSADNAVHLADALLRLATKLRVAEKGMTVQEYTGTQL